VRTLAEGDRGTEVAIWQRVVGATQDGVFGTGTARKTRVWQEVHGLEPDGIVGPESWAAAEVRSTPVEARTDYSVRKGPPAKHYSRLNPKRDRVDFVVIHSAETPERPNTAQSLANYFANPRQMRDGKLVEVKASAHYSVDSRNVVQHVDETDAAWHVRTKGWNARSVGIELAGRASQTRSEWLDEYGMTMLPRAARLVATVCDRWNIPIEYLTGEQLSDGSRGVTGHADLTRQFGEDTHTDPGEGFPWPGFMAMVRAIAEGVRRGGRL